MSARHRMVEALSMIGVAALLESGATLERIEPNASSVTPEPPREPPKPTGIIPHIGKKQIAKALKRAATNQRDANNDR